MILVCKACKSSFLVPATLFSGGPRRVKCTRCGESWLADSPETDKRLQVEPPAEEKPRKAFEAVTESAAETSPPAPVAPLPVAAIKMKKLFLLSGLVTAGTLLLAGFLFAAFHGPIIKTWPSMQYVYISLGLASPPHEDGLFLRKVKSVRKYQDGGMRLVVEGEIFSQAQKTQLVPTLIVEATGPDGKIIQSWRIEPPKATINPGATVPFSSAVLCPNEAVVEVNLRFVERAHDEK